MSGATVPLVYLYDALANEIVSRRMPHLCCGPSFIKILVQAFQRDHGIAPNEPAIIPWKSHLS